MTAHERVAAYVRRTCPDADELLLMLGVVDELGVLQPDDEREIEVASAGPEVRKSAAVERPDDHRVRPKVSTAPAALRNLPAVVVQPRLGGRGGRGVKSTEFTEASREANKRREAPCGTPAAKRRHRRRGEPECETCARTPMTHPGGKARSEKFRRAHGIEPRTSTATPAQIAAREEMMRGRYAPCGSIGAYRRHLRHGDPIDEACKQAARDQWNQRERVRGPRKKAA